MSTHTKQIRHLLPVLVLALAACSSDDPNEPASPASVVTPKSKLVARNFEGCEAYRRYFADSLLRQILQGNGGCWGCEVGIAATDTGAPNPMGPEAGNAAGPASGFQDVTGTNTQEAGIDEADLIEADERGYFYIARGREILVVDALPVESMNIVARVPLQTGDYGYARGLYLDEANQRLVVLVDFTGPFYPSASPLLARFGTGLLFLDVADPAQPVASQWHWSEGYLVDSRRIGERLHFVSRHAYGLPLGLAEDFEFHDQLSDYHQARAEKREADARLLAERIEEKVRAAVASASLPELLPLQKSGLDDSPPAPLACNAVQHTELEHRLGLLLITSINTDGANPATLATINNAWQLYASRNHLYLAQHSGGWWFDERQTQQTAIYRFKLTEGTVVPAGFGVVDGWTRDAYSFGEHQNFLRTVTTAGHFSPEQQRWTTTNHLFVLGEAADGNLETTGEVRDFIRDERIFSSRFLGERGFVVTFRQIDPLFAFDLADPHAPRLAGQVEIPGFSTYIHPLGENHLLTIGRAGNENGIINNIQLQIFDVSNLALPTLKHSYVPPVGPDDWVFSLAEFDPHAFTYYAPASLLSIPVQIGSSDPERSFSGFFALRADAINGFTELGRIDHKRADPGGSGCPPMQDGDPTIACGDFAPVYYNQPLRSVVAQETERAVLYTLSSATLKSGDAADLSVELSSLPLDSAN